jgi:glycosyltransferase involved in cell wall biosynthesis
LKSIEEAKKNTYYPIEVIVVDSSEKETKPVTEALCKKFQARYYYAQIGVSEARNYGTKIAKFPIVFFVDSDCEVEWNLFNEHVKCYTDKQIGGCVGLTEFRGNKTWLWNIIEKMPFLQPFQWARWKSYVSWGPCTNISFRKEILEKANGFESVTGGTREGGEDVDIGYRINSLGHRISCNPNAKVYHTRETWAGLPKFIERTFRFGRAEYHLMKKHPENIFLDIPKNSLIFSFLLILFIYKVFINSSLLYIAIPFAWLLIAIFVQSLLSSRKHLIRGNWKDIAPICFAMLFDLVFEFGTVIECLRKRDLKLLPYKFVYTEDQQLSRWHWGVIKMWSIITSLFALFIVLLIFGR